MLLYNAFNDTIHFNKEILRLGYPDFAKYLKTGAVIFE